MQQAQRDARIGRMEERSLPLDHIPVVRSIVGGQLFRGSRDEIGNDGVHGDAFSGDHDAGLAGRPDDAAIPRPCKFFARARAVYFLPRAQSVPTVNTRLPLRLRPLAAP